MTVLLGSAVPVNVGLLLAVRLSVLLTPVSSVLFCGKTPVGAAGAVVSSVTGTVTGALTLPAGSVSLTIRLLDPSTK